MLQYQDGQEGFFEDWWKGVLYTYENKFLVIYLKVARKLNEHIAETFTRSKGVEYTPSKFNV